MYDDDDRARKYSLVYAGNNKLYAVSKNDEGQPIDIEENPNIPQSVVNDVKGILKNAEDNVEAKLEQYLAPAGSGVRVRVPKILD